MQFTDIRFMFLFPIAAIFCFIIPKKARKVYILLLNCLFIYSWSGKALAVISAETAISYAAALVKDKCGENRKKLGNAVIAAGAAGVLIYFLYCKYSNFALQTFDRIAGREFAPMSIFVPIGVSFYSLQILGYLADVWKGKEKAETNFINYACFVTFFPLICQGPIERTGGFLRQLKTAEELKFSYERIREGLLLMLWGFFLKLTIAERAAEAVSTVFNNYTAYKGFPLMAAAVLYSLQLYADFSGYSHIACGAAKVLGFDITANFNNPYFSESIAVFWRRWHISLSTWLKDYIYIPLGGSRCSKARKYFNLAVTFLVSGFWHGAAWTFIVWGGLHAVFQIAGDLLRPVGEKLNSFLHVDTEGLSCKIARILRTFILTTMAWVFFRAQSFSQALYIIKNSLYFKNYGTVFKGALYELGLDQRNMNILILGTVILFACSIVSEIKKKPAVLYIGSQGAVLRYGFYWVITVFIAISLNISSSEFLYMQF